MDIFIYRNKMHIYYALLNLGRYVKFKFNVLMRKLMLTWLSINDEKCLCVITHSDLERDRQFRPLESAIALAVSTSLEAKI
jgi:hypothetical protein